MDTIQENKILFTIIVIILFAFILLFCKMNKGIGVHNTKIFGITFVASLGTILSLSDISQNNLTAIYGILGTIIGYLFGLKNEDKKPKQ